jgi:hypothetical protein
MAYTENSENIEILIFRELSARANRLGLGRALHAQPEDVDTVRCQIQHLFQPVPHPSREFSVKIGHKNTFLHATAKVEQNGGHVLAPLIIRYIVTDDVSHRVFSSVWSSRMLKNSL